MKNLLIAFLLLWCTQTYAQIKSATVTASGLTCSMCSKAIYKSVMKLPFVKNVIADVERSSFEITFKEGGRPELEEVKKAVQDAGFSVASMHAVVRFSDDAVFNNAVITADGSAFHFMDVEKQTLNGDKTIKVVDKGYLPAKEYKKYSNHNDINSSKHSYHVTI